MASIFTFDPEPVRVSSPWLTPTDTPKSSTPQPRGRNAIPGSFPPPGNLEDYGVTRLEAEPQEGPTEYKLHLLLRPRRNYSSSSTGFVVSGSQHNKQQSLSHVALNDSAPILAPSNQSRQNRLEQLTTQLLWRLQQSSPYHASSTSDLVLPKLPEAAESLENPTRPGKLLAGLEESRGALYEIGVSDDGTLIGLTKDEMDESLVNLRAMAASLGCNVEVMRMVAVGECEWHESAVSRGSLNMLSPAQDKDIPSGSYQPGVGLRYRAKLWVAEALVTPDLGCREAPGPDDFPITTHQGPIPATLHGGRAILGKADTHNAAVQLRVTLTGPTTSGKSSLLGTLSTATLDNGRGKSRLSLLKHRHEIVSGITSSVAQELVGYNDQGVINYASGNVASWTDIHALARNGRLVFVSDGAGHPKFRRTTVRGLIGWAPHWTLLCIAADDGENAPSNAGGTSSAKEIFGAAGAGIDLGQAHLELCLKLDKPLAIVITKLDLASKTSLRKTLTKVLSAIKSAGRKPSIIPPDQTKSLDQDSTSIPEKDENAVRSIIEKMTGPHRLTSIVPIVMTSAAKGTGMWSMHALLKSLPIPPPPTSQDFVGPALNPEQPSCLFHIEDVFSLPASYEPLASTNGHRSDTGVVVAGHLRFGKLSVGDVVVVGPFPAGWEDNDPPLSRSDMRSSPNSFGASMSNPSAMELSHLASRSAVSAAVTKGEWHSAHIVSLRNLRLPVHTLEAGQVGTIGIIFNIPEEEVSNGPFERLPPPTPRIRKGLVLAIPSRHMIETEQTLQAASGFTASFEDGDINSITPGSLVVVYIASIRASARVLHLVPHINKELDAWVGESDDIFGLGESFEVGEKRGGTEPLIFGSDGVTDVTLELLTNREWIELGSQVLLMPGGGHGLYYGSGRGEKGVAGLDGFVGKVIEVVD